MSNTVSDQRIRNALTKLAPSLKDHDAVLRGYTQRVRNTMDSDTELGFESAMAALASDILNLEAQFKAAK